MNSQANDDYVDENYNDHDNNGRTLYIQLNKWTREMGFWVEILRRSMYLEIKKAEIIFSLNVLRNYCHRNHLIRIV